MVGWKKKRRELGPDLHPGKGAVKQERFPHSGKTFHQWEDQPEQKGSFRGSEESATASCQQAVQRETGTENPCYLTAIPSPRCVPASMYVGRMLNWQFQKIDSGRWLRLVAGRQPEVGVVWAKNEGGGPPHKISSGLPLKQSIIVKQCAKGGVGPAAAASLLALPLWALKWYLGASVARMGPALAAVDFVGVCMPPFQWNNNRHNKEQKFYGPKRSRTY